MSTTLGELIDAYSNLSIADRTLFKRMIDTINNGQVKPAKLTDKQESEEAPTITHRHFHRYWAFCEAVDWGGSNLKRYQNSVACWKAEIGDPKTTGYTGWENKNALDSFKHKGWGIAFGDPNHKEKGMRVVRPKKA